LQRALAEEGLDLDVYLDSAGTHGYHVGHPPDRRAMEAAMRRGVDLAPIRSRRVTDEDFEIFDLIVAMDRDNLEHLRYMCPPALQDRLRLFMDFSADSSVEEVPDPYYGGLKGFDRVLDLVEDAADGLIEEIIRRQRLRTA